ncbi:MAG: hypothetical protein R3Y09_03820 [Clostridia bacterium]
MINIVDRTLSCLDSYDISCEDILRFIDLLVDCDVTKIEISKHYFDKIRHSFYNSKSKATFVLRISNLEDVKNYPEIDNFICDKIGNKEVMAEININDVHDSRILNQYVGIPLRITGLDGLFHENIADSFKYLKNSFSDRKKNTLEFCAGDSLHCATALAMEWIYHLCGNTVVTSVGGIGGFAAFEEVLIGCRHLFRRHPNTNYSNLPKLRKLLSSITDEKIEMCAPVIGEGIFAVETGIHIGGILKHPKCYELFSPESVGLKRKFVYGKFSGKSGVRSKLLELNLQVPDKLLEEITARIKNISQEIESILTDEQVREIALEVMENNCALSV